ncbi:MAG: UvrD-helicase domain-containing protein [Holosporales bacterium]|jgi:ATP-dependent helicase/nuclease subunit A|nr:UvrD-helicase domain-containing protein [Holosporales bacterium]
MSSDATDISSSCFVFASAGSGKTKVLVDRYVKLLIFGMRPCEILCLTFTNAAAFEMESRIIAILEKLCLDEDNFVEVYLSDDLGLTDIDQEITNKAKDLFFKFQDELHEIKIMTIHSFCQNILLKFPFEAGIDADCEVIDENEARDLMGIAKNTALELIYETDPDAIRILSRLISSHTLEELVNKILSSPAKFIDFFRKHDDLDQYEEHLKQIFKLGEQIDIPKDQIDPILHTFQASSLEEVFLTKTGTLRKNIRPEYNKISHVVYMNNINDRKRLLIRKTISFLRIVKIIFNTYQDLKRQNDVIDFDDILYMTHYLLTKSSAKEFAISRICNAIRCIMIDEAQDLSPIQWELVTIFSEDILTSHGDGKTIFVVGDIKQSIYRFQGANYNALLEFYQMCKEALHTLDRKLKTVYLNISYRSLPCILDAVDAVFSKFDLVQYQRHIPYRQGDSGTVKFIEFTDVFQIVEYIKELNADDLDILILTRSRNDLSDTMLKELADAGLRVASPDRIILSQSILVMDVLALAEFCGDYTSLEMVNTYALCCILKSPHIFSNPLSDDELYYLCDTDDILGNLKEKYRDHWNEIQRVSSYYKRDNLIAFFYYVLNYVVKKQNTDDDVIVSSLMEHCLKFSQRKSSEIPAFIKYIRKLDTKISIQNTKMDGIRLSTIHGAKGLEASVVCLLAFPLSADKAKTKMICNQNLFILKPAKPDSFKEIESILDGEYKEEEEELLRLLYVAMTRARDSLFIFGRESDIFRNLQNYWTEASDSDPQLNVLEE